ncbi:hypothetical protein ACOME3_002357 [Neoechinorhynchus agilis]
MSTNSMDNMDSPPEFHSSSSRVDDDPNGLLDRKRPISDLHPDSSNTTEQGEILDDGNCGSRIKKQMSVSSTAHSSPLIHMKFLIPSVVAGSVIGRGGDLIAEVQRRTLTRMKMSKTTDYYPGTNERICLVIGELRRVLEVYDYIMEKLKCRFSPTLAAGSECDVNGVDRTHQVLFLVPNSTAGMLIGKSGSYIRHIKESTGAMVNVAPRNEEMNERIGMVASLDDVARRNEQGDAMDTFLMIRRKSSFLKSFCRLTD